MCSSGQRCKGEGIFSHFPSLPLDDAIKEEVHTEVRPKGTAAPFPDVVWGQGGGGACRNVAMWRAGPGLACL